MNSNFINNSNFQDNSTVNIRKCLGLALTLVYISQGTVT